MMMINLSLMWEHFSGMFNQFTIHVGVYITFIYTFISLYAYCHAMKKSENLVVSY